MNSFAAIVVLLGLFWLVFSIVGLHVFGALHLGAPGWPNCDTFISCAILNFHVRPSAIGLAFILLAGQTNDTKA
jgi:hypothetical protein